MGGKVYLRCKGKTLLGVVNKLLKAISWHHQAMFHLITSSKLSRQWFEFQLKVKVMGLNPSYLLKSFLLYSAGRPYQMLMPINKLPCIRFILTIFKDRCLFYIFCLVLCFIKKPDFAGVNFFLETDRFWLHIIASYLSYNFIIFNLDND